MEKIEPQLRAFVMNPCLYYSTLSVIYALDAVSSFPGIMMGIVMISQIVADAANFMDMRESDAYTNQSRRCSASFNFIGNLLAVAFSSAGLLGVFVSLFGHFHILGFLGRFLPLVFFILSIYRVRSVVQEGQRERERQNIITFSPNGLHRTTSLGGPDRVSSNFQPEQAKPTVAFMSINPPILIESASLKLSSDQAIHKKPVSRTLMEHFSQRHLQTSQSLNIEQPRNLVQPCNNEQPHNPTNQTPSHPLERPSQQRTPFDSSSIEYPPANFDHYPQPGPNQYR